MTGKTFTLKAAGLFALSVLSLPALAAPQTDLGIATTLMALIAVIGLIFLVAWIMKRMKLPGLQMGDTQFRVLRQLPMGQKERIVLLQVGDEQLLVGVTQHNISLLSKLDTPLTEQQLQSNSDFAQQFSQLIKKNDKK